MIKLQGDINEWGNLEVRKQLQGLGQMVLGMHRWVTERIPISLGITVHPYKPGDQVGIQDQKREPLRPTWKGPYSVMLTAPTALEVAGQTTWIHPSRVKLVHLPGEDRTRRKVTLNQNSLRGSPLGGQHSPAPVTPEALWSTSG